MANEISINISMHLAKGSVVSSKEFQAILDQAGTNFIRLTQTIGTIEEQLELGDVGTLGMLMLFNLDATNFVEVGAVTAQYGVKLGPNEPALFRPNGAGIFCKADTASCDVEAFLIED